ncbi:hypothetical protein C1701_21220 [Actinoalloteichus sp. AHMU CJ021]|nr:hypothetical protein C1701_21220 [Actinoalloteichus sp. AHMU CJ021]
MIDHVVRTYPSAEPLPKEEQLAWKLAAVATDPVAVEPEVTEMVRTHGFGASQGSPSRRQLFASPPARN